MKGFGVILFVFELGLLMGVILRKLFFVFLFSYLLRELNKMMEVGYLV